MRLNLEGFNIVTYVFFVAFLNSIPVLTKTQWHDQAPVPKTELEKLQKHPQEQLPNGLKSLENIIYSRAQKKRQHMQVYLSPAFAEGRRGNIGRSHLEQDAASCFEQWQDNHEHRN